MKIFTKSNYTNEILKTEKQFKWIQMKTWECKYFDKNIFKKSKYLINTKIMKIKQLTMYIAICNVNLKNKLFMKGFNTNLAWWYSSKNFNTK